MKNKKRKFKSLLENNPEIASHWHPIKNGELTPDKVSYGSPKKVWWKCNKSDDHEWETTVNSRTNINSKNCPFCVGQRVCVSNCLATLNPTIAKEWHPTKNGKLTPYDFVLKSKKKVWWKCEKGDEHEWESIINNRTDKGKGCPYCSGRKASKNNSLFYNQSDILKEWHPTKNFDLSPQKITAKSHIKVWWQCLKDKNHEWISVVKNRTIRNDGCPFCRTSHGEKYLRDFFIKNKIKFEPQKKFDKCINKKTKFKLPFDFYLPDYNVCIEYDGIQHFQPVKKFGGNIEFIELQKRDVIKTKFCKKNHITLIRIKYTESIDDKLNNFFNMQQSS